MTDLAALPTNRLDAATAGASLHVCDQDLLARYVANREEGAFARLVERHGWTVWGVCRRVLHQKQDVEDAFQAVFIILARKAALIRKGEAVGSWLYSVAYRTAMKAKLRRAKARSETRQTSMEVEPEAKREETPWAQAACRELQCMLDEELQNLPEKLRTPFVLCCVEGMSKSEAAQELGWKEGTVSNRLALARKQLHWRLARRGVTLSSILIASALVQNSASAAAPAVMMHAAAQAAATPVVGQATAVSPSAAMLAEVVLPTVGAAKVSASVSLVLAASVLLAGAGLVALQPDGGVGKVQQEEAIVANDPENFMQPASPLVAPIDEQVLTLGFSPDGKRLVTAGARHIHPGQIRIWDVASRTVLATLKGVPGVRSLAMSPTGEAFATGDFASTVRIRDAQTGKELATAKGHKGAVNGIAWSADGMHLATASLDNTVKLWDAKDLKEKKAFVGHTDWVFTVAMFKHGGAIVSGSRDNTAKIWDVATGKVKFNLAGHASAVEAVAVSPDDKIVATASWDQTVKLWDADTGKEIGVLETKNPWAALIGLAQNTSAAYFVAFSPDGDLLATGSADGSVRLWNVKTRKLVANLGRHTGATWSVAFTRDGKTLASGSSDKTAKLWDVPQRKEIATLDTSELGPVAALAYSPDARIVAIAQGRKVEVRDATTGNLTLALTGHEETTQSLAFAPDGQTLASGSSDSTIKIWDLATGKEKRTLEGHKAGVHALAFSRDGKKLASGSFEPDNTIKWWDVDTGKELATLPGHQGAIRALAVSPDGMTLASGGGDGKIKLWDVAKEAEPRTLDAHEGGVRALAFSATGRLASAGDDRLVKVWDVAEGKVRIELTGHQGQVWAIAYSPGGSTLVSGGPKDISVWDANTGHRRGVLKGHQDRVTSLAIHPHGRELLSGSRDTSVLRWRAMSSTPPPITLQGTPTGVWFATFSPAGDRLATGGAGGNITFWTRGLSPVEFVYPTGARTFREAAYSAEGKFFAVGGTKEVFVFDAASTQLKHLIPVGQNVRTVAFSPDSKYLAAGTGDMGKPNTPSQTRVFELATGAEVMTLNHEAAVLRLLFSPDGKTLITSSMDKTRRLFEVPTGKEKTILRGHKGAARGMVLLPDGTLVTAGYDGSIRFWDIEAATEKRAALRPGMGLASLAASPDGTLLAAAESAADGKGPAPLKVWDAATGKEKLKLQGHTGRILGVAFTHDGLGLIATGGELSNYGEISYWDLISGQLRSNHKHGKQWIEMPVVSKDGRRVVSPSGNGLYLWDLNLTHKERSWEGHKSFTSCALFLDQGRVLATGAADGTINVWNVRTGDRIGPLNGHTDIIRNLAVLADGKTLVSSSGDKTIRLWDLTTLKEKVMLEGNDPKLSVFSLAVAPDGKTLASGAGNFDWNPGELILWDLDTLKMRQKLPDVHAVLTLAYSPDGALLAAGAFDGSVKVWDTKSNQLRAKLKLPYARPVKFSPDGKLLVAAGGKAPSKPPKQPESGDGRIRVWETGTWKERPTLVGHENVIFGVDVSPDGATIASAGQDGTIKLWQTPNASGATVPIVVARRPDAVTAVGVNKLVGTGDVMVPAPSEIPQTAPIRWRLWISLAVAGLVAVAAGVGVWRMQRRRGAAPLTQADVTAPPTEGGATPIVFSCAGCGKQLKAKAELAGRRVKCPQCGKLVQVVPTGITER